MYEKKIQNKTNTENRLFYTYLFINYSEEHDGNNSVERVVSKLYSHI